MAEIVSIYIFGGAGDAGVVETGGAVSAENIRISNFSFHKLLLVEFVNLLNAWYHSKAFMFR